MNFSRGRKREEPEINFIPLIDLLLVILIFLMVTTTYNRFAELKINLPAARADPPAEKNHEIRDAVSAEGQIRVDHQVADASSLANTHKPAAGSHAVPTVVIEADGKATHQAVVSVMEAARQANLGKLTFATRAPAR